MMTGVATPMNHLRVPALPCPRCGGASIIIDTVAPNQPQSGAKNTKAQHDRSTTDSDNTLSRRSYQPRTHRGALIKLSTMHQWRTPVKYRAYRTNTGNVDAMFCANGPVQPTCRIKTATSPKRKSHSQLTQQAKRRDFPLKRFSDAKQRSAPLKRCAWRPRNLHHSGHTPIKAVLLCCQSDQTFAAIAQRCASLRVGYLR